MSSSSSPSGGKTPPSGSEPFPPDTKTQFELWKEAHNGKTTLEQQIDLASRLWDDGETNQEPSSNNNTPSIIEALKKTPIQDSDSLVSWKGFQVGWFLNVFCKMPYMQKLIDFGCELWFVRKVCIIETVRQAHCAMNGNPDNDVPVLSDPFVEVVDTILDGFGLEGNTDEIVQEPTTFISYTGACSSWTPTSKSRSPEMQQFKETFLDDLQGQIQCIGKTALVLEKWDDVMRTLEQIWVLWEIFNTADAGTDLEVLLPLGQTQDFITNCLESHEKFETIMASLASVDANKARAEDDDDRAKIFERIQESGVSKVNNLATSAMRGWMQKQGMACLEEQRKDGGEGPSPLFLNNLALLLDEQGKLEEAEPLYREALDKHQKVLGPDHPDTLTSIVSLAGLLRTQGKIDEAELLFQQALEKQQKLLGPDHPETLTSIHNLANFLKAQGNLEKADPLYRHTLEKRQNILGPDHPDTLISINNLALLLQDQGKLDEAEPLFRQALIKSLKVLGPDHPSTLTSINNLAFLLQAQGKLEEAEPLYWQALEKQQKVLGLDHPDTLISISNLAFLLNAQGRLEEAEPLYQQALDKRQRVLGPDHPSTLISMNNLAFLWYNKGDTAEAKILLRDCLEKSLRVLGQDHPHTTHFQRRWNDWFGGTDSDW